MKIVPAMSFCSRLVGLLMRKQLSQDEGIYFPHCNAVHTCFMRFPIMVVFCRSGKIVQCHSYVKPWRFLRCAAADSVFEFAVQKNRGVSEPYSSWDSHTEDERLLMQKIQGMIDQFLLGISPKAEETY